MSSRHGIGHDLFEPAVRIAIEGGRITVPNPGYREWDRRPRWHGIVYGNGRAGTGRASVVAPGATAWPISPRTAETRKPDQKKIAPHVKFYGADGVAETMADHGVEDLPLVAYATDAPEGRRMTDELRGLIHRLDGRGFVTGSVAKTLNLKPERVRRVLREPETSILAASA